MSGEFRELSRPTYMHEALTEAADADPGSHRISQALQPIYRALAHIEAGAAWHEAGDSGPEAPAMALIRNWRELKKSVTALGGLMLEYTAVMEEAVRMHEMGGPS